MARTTIHELLRASRSRLDRVVPEQALEAVREGAVLVDIRTEAQRERDGTIPGAVVHARNVLEWRVDPTSGHSDPRLSSDVDRRIILVCNEGYQSSLAAATLQHLGFRHATDLAGGFQAWLAAGLPVSAPASARDASRRTPARPPSDRRSGSTPPVAQ
jgi:rhodanese-related sulfurtransferase